MELPATNKFISDDLSRRASVDLVYSNLIKSPQNLLLEKNITCSSRHASFENLCNAANFIKSNCDILKANNLNLQSFQPSNKVTNFETKPDIFQLNSNKTENNAENVAKGISLVKLKEICSNITDKEHPEEIVINENKANSFMQISSNDSLGDSDKIETNIRDDNYKVSNYLIDINCENKNEDVKLNNNDLMVIKNINSMALTINESKGIEISEQIEEENSELILNTSETTTITCLENKCKLNHLTKTNENSPKIAQADSSETLKQENKYIQDCGERILKELEHPNKNEHNMDDNNESAMEQNNIAKNIKCNSQSNQSSFSNLEELEDLYNRREATQLSKANWSSNSIKFKISDKISDTASSQGDLRKEDIKQDAKKLPKTNANYYPKYLNPFEDNSEEETDYTINEKQINDIEDFGNNNHVSKENHNQHFEQDVNMQENSFHNNRR